MSMRAVLNPLRRAAASAPKIPKRNMSGGGSIEDEVREYEKWRTVTYIAIPACGAFGAYIVANHHEHGDHRVNYDHLKIRNKRFPWPNGDCQLFGKCRGE
eukprot:CAMPEP_0114249828 /NCGR_PEP_ID=MMETSP0058-20121206/14365_1 /TAXON_ID=36894 /ORGANISM="Pyramimonas parkeae, CCMP726" /LENGTH=99 /DNA_ID=CAMNT_0001363429 /DNA_START=77 /DNA_END=376 /DNA_ORIENTATION=-